MHYHYLEDDAGEILEANQLVKATGDPRMKRKPTFSPRIGSISGPHPEAAPIADLAYALRGLLTHCRVEREVRKTHGLVLRWAEYPHRKGASKEVLKDLIEALSHYAPPYTTFGERENERGEMEWGFWPYLDVDLPRINLPTVEWEQERDKWGQECLMVNDHGNIECGRFDKRGRWHEYWSCV